MTTRSQILLRAFTRIGIASYEFDVTPDERASARATLDSMMAEWEAKEVGLGYTPSIGDNDAVVMTTPLYADEPIAANLAMRLAPEYGKTPAPQLVKDAGSGWALVKAKTMTVPVQKRPRVGVSGGGDYYRRWNF